MPDLTGHKHSINGAAAARQPTNLWGTPITDQPNLKLKDIDREIETLQYMKQTEMKEKHGQEYRYMKPILHRPPKVHHTAPRRTSIQPARTTSVKPHTGLKSTNACPAQQLHETVRDRFGWGAHIYDYPVIISQPPLPPNYVIPDSKTTKLEAEAETNLTDGWTSPPPAGNRESLETKRARDSSGVIIGRERASVANEHSSSPAEPKSQINNIPGSAPLVRANITTACGEQQTLEIWPGEVPLLTVEKFCEVAGIREHAKYVWEALKPVVDVELKRQCWPDGLDEKDYNA
ncbi:uncharacterized protein SPPG_04609 [Spizellomyces punctatus DAOM BR117]|uniref:Uncharacterized protein n=1 Tax=Spizellomyces punctatus (strain DAOM BR117) TaxID=645134 RepID=A0A0L0HHD9_SPIPD|nr:uncharacterized protein SPPG_04609 [Spizellomyces punctatus DAOM BR117]KND00280.1 hypothetical protein SPPG_04609 [Spizellomyces punctatus DAOM BR117]|eukprot:XP_016608319.1 hypothetical protein SPPG_04609 [Spizellomyces punctatus DAOM BR117]